MGDHRGKNHDPGDPSPVERLEQLHRHNMEVFGAFLPGMFELLEQHDPVDVSLKLDGDGVVNLVNEQTGATVYPGDPVACCREQVDRFRREPKFVRATPRRSQRVIGGGPGHPSLLLELLLERPQEEPDELPDQVDFVLVLGLGLGYHLEQLLQETDIRHLCIIEPEVDLMLASTHTIDWLPILRHFQQPGYSMNLILGADREGCTTELFGYLEQIGSFNVVVSYIYSHLRTEALDQALDVFVQRVLPTRFEDSGSFEDSRIGLAHTIENFRAGIPFLQEETNPDTGRPRRPAFIVGSGPSLDGSIEFLREFQDRVVVFSCGTALGSLARAGIKPDFHIVQENLRSEAEWIRHATDAEQRDGVILLGLNTVHPEVFALFECVGIGMKMNEPGVGFLQHQKVLSGSEVSISECNPTVVNAALGFVKAMGFSEVYLLGIDLGFPAGEKHHSELSLYYDLKPDEAERLEFPRRPTEDVRQVPGNFQPEVVTSSLFLRTKESLEASLARAPDLRCYNTSSGILIRGARPMRIAEIRLESPAFDKDQEVRALFDDHFGTAGLKPLRDEHIDTLREGLLVGVSQLEAIAERPVKTRREAMASLADLHAALTSILADENNRQAGILLGSGLPLYFMLMAQALFRVNDEGDAMELHNRCREQFLAFLRDAPRVVRQRLLELDQALDNLPEKLTTVA